MNVLHIFVVNLLLHNGLYNGRSQTAVFQTSAHEIELNVREILRPFALRVCVCAVSYTHLDVYKRQILLS